MAATRDDDTLVVIKLDGKRERCPTHVTLPAS